MLQAFFMATLLDTLKDLHTVQSELATSRSELQRCPLQLKARETDLTRRRTALDTDRERIKRCRMDIHEKEVSLKTGEDRVATLNAKLNQAKSNKEYDSLQEEIRTFAGSNGTLEEEILTLIDDEETLAEKIAEAERVVAEVETEVAKFKEVIDYKIEKLTARIKTLEAKEGEHEGELDSGTRADYRRLSKTKGVEAALAGCDDSICQSCYTEQTAQQWSDLIMGRVVVCHTCGAMLYKI